MRIRSARALLRSDFHDNRHMKPVEQIESEAVRAGKIRPPDIAYSVRPPCLDLHSTILGNLWCDGESCGGRPWALFTLRGRRLMVGAAIVLSLELNNRELCSCSKLAPSDREWLAWRLCRGPWAVSLTDCTVQYCWEF